MFQTNPEGTRQLSHHPADHPGGLHAAFLCHSLSHSREVQKAATCIAKKAVDLDIVPGRSPISVAAAAIYMGSQASDDKRTQREIADIAGVADVTIRQSYKLMLPRAAELFPVDFKFTTPIENLPQN